MRIATAAMARRRLVLAAVMLLSLIGLAAWFNMDRQEDPSFPHRYGDILVSWPGADPERIARLVLNPLEEELIQVEEINEIRATARLGLAHLIVGMHAHVYDTDAVWERVRVAADRAARRIPAEATVEVRDRAMDTHGIVLAITGSDDLLALLDAARQLRRDMFRITDIGRIELLGDPGEQIEITFDPARTVELGLTPGSLAAQLQGANQVLPAGTLKVGERNLVLRAHSDFARLAELVTLPIRTADGALLPLSEIADVRLTTEEPVAERLWFDGRPAVALAIVIPENRLNAVRFGRLVRERVESLRADYQPLVVEEMFYQPAWVEQRLTELGRSLLLGAFIVATLLLLTMGPRLGLVVAVMLPLVTLSGLAVYAIGGGVLHQIAIAGLVIALGMLVDNAIVMVENVQWHLDRGRAPAEAAAAAVRELAGPLAAATGTTLAVFTPLLLSSGDTADFTRAIPVMVMLILLVSYLYALLVTPAMAGSVLRPAGPDAGVARAERVGTRLGQLAIRSPVLILAGAALLILLALALSGWMQRDFFPSTDRNQLIVDLQFAEGTRIESTALQAGVVAAELGALPRVRQVHHFAGFSGPRFFYNLLGSPRAPHLARVVVISERDDDLPAIMTWARHHLPALVPEAQLVVRRLGQGPPVEAPIEIRLFGAEAGALAQAAEAVMAVLRATPGAEDVRHRLGDGIPTLHFEIDDAEVARHGVSRRAIAEALAQATHGQPVSTWRAGREPLPMVLRSPEGESLPAHALEGLMVDTAGGPLPLTLFVTTRMDLQPAVIEHRNLRRMTAVLAGTSEGVTHAAVLARLAPKLEQLTLPAGVRLEAGGAVAEDASANRALFQTLPIGLLLLLVFLLWQFNSFRRVGIVLLTVPLTAIGVIPGLILAGQPFGFTALLGVIALVGIVVNNAIVLIDLMDRLRRDGVPVAQAIVDAVARRTRPILLTTATTVAGLFPLTLTQSTLWPPMAWAIISGLLAATLLTLLVIPATYRLVVR